MSRQVTPCEVQSQISAECTKVCSPELDFVICRFPQQHVEYVAVVFDSVRNARLVAYDLAMIETSDELDVVCGQVREAANRLRLMAGDIRKRKAETGVGSEEVAVTEIAVIHG